VGSKYLLKKMTMDNNAAVYVINSVTEVLEQQVDGTMNDSVFEVPE
jgi:hypothetical protein